MGLVPWDVIHCGCGMSGCCALCVQYTHIMVFCVQPVPSDLAYKAVDACTIPNLFWHGLLLFPHIYGKYL